MSIDLETKVNHGHVLREQVALDLRTKLEDYRNHKIGVRILAQKMDISERTLNRLLKLENRPTYQTLLKIYSVIFETSNEDTLLKLVPSIIRETVLKQLPSKKKNSKGLVNQVLPDIAGEIFYDRCFAELYVLASCAPLTRELIQYRFGLHGMTTLEKMIELKAIKQNSQGQYILGENQIELDTKTLKKIGLSMSEKYAKVQNAEVGGENLIAFYAEGLSDEAYEKWLKIDEEAFYKKMDVLKETGALGNKRAFTYMVTDTMSEK